MSAPSAAFGGRPVEARIALVAGLVAIGWSILVLDPLGAATIDPDASSSVLYFQRIVSGRALEAFVPTTPKPLLTIVFGLTWSLLHDWRALVWETVLIWGVAVGATAAVVARLADRVTTRFGDARPGDSRGAQASGTASARSGATALAAAPIAAAAFATAALVGSSDILLEVSRANSLVWALAGWSIAGLAVTVQPARPRLAGLALLFAALCRFETVALIAVAVVAVATWRRATREGSGPRLVPGIAESVQHFQERRAAVRLTRRASATRAIAGASVAALALPVILLHDWLLSGDPFYWLSVPSRYTAIFNPGLQAIGPLDFAGTIFGRIAPEWPLLLLAAIGVVALARARDWLMLAGIAAIGLGVVALLFLLAARATYISNRYYEPIDLALIVAAAIGAGWLAARLAGGRPGVVTPAVAAAAFAAGVAVMWPALPWDRRATAELNDVRAASAHLAAVRDDLARLLVLAGPDGRVAATALLVPSRDVARVSVETGASLERVQNSYALLLKVGVDALRSGQVVFHDAAADRPVALYRPLEVDDQEPVAGNILVRLEPRVSGIWLLSVR